MRKTRHRVDVFLPPGALVVRVGDVNIKTIVGSCVAVSLWDPRQQVGGVNHYLLPCPLVGDQADNRFGTVAIAKLVDEMCCAGARITRLHAAVIGGGSPVSALRNGSVGLENTRIALQELKRLGIAIQRRETGGDHGRKLLFNAATGALVVRHIRGCAEINATRSAGS